MTSIKVDNDELMLIQAIRMRNQRLFQLKVDDMPTARVRELEKAFETYDNEFVMPLVHKLLGIASNG